MSYDLSVYCPGSPSVDQVWLLAGNTRGLHADSSNSDISGVRVFRGVKRSYSFTVDGPFSIEIEDVPGEVSQLLPKASTLFQVLVEGTQEAEIPHGVRFARKLAKACHGIVMDEQTDEIWPQPRAVREQPEPEERVGVNDVWLNWYLLEDDLPMDFLERYLRIAEELLPEAIPVRFGKHEPLQFRFDAAGIDGLIDEYYNSEANDWGVYYKNPSPVTYGKIAGPEQAAGNPFTRITLCVDSRSLTDDRLRASLKSFFLAVATDLGAVYASAEKVTGGEMPRIPYLYMPPRQWVGFPPYPLWWVWAGPRLACEIGRFLGPAATEHNAGLFRAYSDLPLDRHELMDSLGPDNLPWIPPEFSASYSDRSLQIDPLTIATVIPEILRNREPLDLPPGIYNPPQECMNPATSAGASGTVRPSRERSRCVL